MKHNEFCYWLQGYFELSSTSSFNSEQITCIKKHLLLVQEVEKSLNDFCGWLNGYLDAYNNEYMSVTATEVIKTKLNYQFEHVIDKSYGQSLNAALSELHGTIGIYNTDQTIRC